MTLITQQIDNLTTEIMRLNYMAQDVSHMLQEQSNLLRIRNMSLPTPLLEETQGFSEAVKILSEQLASEQVELAQLRALAHTGGLINSSLDLDTVLRRAMDTVIGLTGAVHGYIMLLDQNTGETESVISVNLEQGTAEEGEIMISRTIVDEVMRTRQPIVTTDVQDDERFQLTESVLKYDLRSILCVPIIYRDQLSGVVYADNRIREGLFGESELNLLVAFANQAAIAIQNARLFERVKARLAEVTAIRQFLDSIFASIASAVITTDVNGNIRTCSPVAEQILGVSAVECISQPVMEVLPSLYEGFENVLIEVQQQGHQEIIEVNTVLAHRGPTSLSLKLSPLRGEQNETLGVAIVLDDLTAIKERDETLNVIRTYLPPAMVRNIQSIDSLGLGGEEREITVIFADVRGFTTFSERLPPEELMEVINQYLSTGSAAIQLLEGIIDKYMGDAIVGLYNTQLNPQNDDHALRAVRAAIALVNDVQALHEVMPAEQRLFYGIGIHTGTAIVGNVGSPSRKEFTALGYAVTFAKKLQEIAQPGEIIISEETYQAVKDRVVAQPTERRLRGDNTPVMVYQLTDIR
ncbi:MAG: GAF domain-containing protein [Chloroflexi bacterium]|nr:GAF domain-containing protein [Chloroflexota bacterium]